MDNLTPRSYDEVQQFSHMLNGCLLNGKPVRVVDAHVDCSNEGDKAHITASPEGSDAPLKFTFIMRNY